jgi:hypothetical protein
VSLIVVLRYCIGTWTGTLLVGPDAICLMVMRRRRKRESGVVQLL